MKTFAGLLLAAAIVLVLIAWKFPFRGEKTVRKVMQGNRWVTTNVNDSTTPVRRRFYLIALLTGGTGALLYGITSLPARRESQ